MTYDPAVHHGEHGEYISYKPIYKNNLRPSFVFCAGSQSMARQYRAELTYGMSRYQLISSVFSVIAVVNDPAQPT
jgi:hypothetical protein